MIIYILSYEIELRSSSYLHQINVVRVVFISVLCWKDLLRLYEILLN